MTNKLRSVIEENIQYLSGYGASRVAVLECELGLLDAIIEEIEEQAKTSKQHIDEMKKLNYTEQDIDFHRGKTMYAINLSQELKQAREELSTSLTQ